MKSQKGLLFISLLVVAFAAFAGVAFVQSSETIKSGTTEAQQVAADGSGCPYKGKTDGAQAEGMPGSCSEVHSAALAAGRMSKDDYLKAEVQLASVAGGTAEVTPEQCKELLTKAGYQCNEKDLKACAAKIQSLGFCKDMSVEECAAGLAKGTCEPLTIAKSGGACCAAGKTVKAGDNAEVKTAVVTETITGKAQPKVCDLSKGTCGPAAKKTSDQ